MNRYLYGFFFFCFPFFYIGLEHTKIGYSNPIQNFIEFIWSTLSGIIRQQLDKEQRFSPLFIWTFIWIAYNNVIGLIPFNLTLTAHLSVTLYLALGFNLGFFIWGLYHHSFRFFLLFVPKGAPLFLLPLIVLIEIISYCIRPVSLALRLFANMMAGHTLVHILLSFLASANLIGVAFGSVAILFVTLLEFGIALLQAYVFLVLCCIYLRDALEPSH
ncbi:ATP synthase F0 subunit A [bacterium]|nr:MAG: ATP synthase F0 subunit A [bacterium]